MKKPVRCAKCDGILERPIFVFDQHGQPIHNSCRAISFSSPRPPAELPPMTADALRAAPTLREALQTLIDALDANQRDYSGEVSDEAWDQVMAALTHQYEDALANARAALTAPPKASEQPAQPHQLPPSLALRAWNALSEVDYEFDPPQRILDLMYELQLVAQGRTASAPEPVVPSVDPEGRCANCGLEFESPAELTHECPPGFVRSTEPVVPLSTPEGVDANSSLGNETEAHGEAVQRPVPSPSDIRKAVMRWYRANRPENWAEHDFPDYRPATLTFTADFELWAIAARVACAPEQRSGSAFTHGPFVRDKPDPQIGC